MTTSRISIRSTTRPRCRWSWILFARIASVTWIQPSGPRSRRSISTQRSSPKTSTSTRCSRISLCLLPESFSDRRQNKRGASIPGRGARYRRTSERRRPSVPAERLARLRRLIAEAGYDAVVAMSPDNVTYAAGFTVPSQRWSRRRLVMAVVLPEGPTRQIVVNIEESLTRAVSWLDEVVSYNEFTQHPVDLLADSLRELVGGKARVGIELDFIPQAAYARLLSLLPALRIEDVSQFLLGVRAVKMPDEIEALRWIGRTAQLAMHQAVGVTRAGETELDLAHRISVGMLERGADTVAELIVASGERSGALLRWPKSACGGAIRPGWCSDHEGQLGERVNEAGSERCLGPEIVEASAKVLDEGMPGDDDPGDAITLQSPHRSESSLQPSVVCLDGIVRVDLRFMEGRREHLVQDPGVEAVPVGGDLDR